MTVLKLGSQGAEVRNLQSVLAELGFNVEPDGQFGPGTKAAVIAAQKAMGLTADGTVGPKTWDGLDSAYQPGVHNFTSSGVLTKAQVAAVEKPVASPGDIAGHPKLKGTHPALAARMMKLIELAAADGITVRVTHGLRTFAEQDALYAQGRTKPGPRVTAAAAGRSMHNWGFAADVAILVEGKVTWEFARYAALAKYANQVGLEAGSSWKLKDGPHFQLADLPSSATLLKTYNASGGGDKGIAAVWARHVTASTLGQSGIPAAPSPPQSPQTGAPIMAVSPDGKWTLADAGVLHAAVESLYDTHRNGKFDPTEVRSWMRQEVIPALRAGQDPNKILNYLDGELAKGG